MSQLEKVEMKHQVNSSWVSYRNLGSVRVVMAADGTAEQVNHYYAFGGLMGDSSGGDVQKYKYNGKELDRFFGWDMLDYGARWYDSKLQCWSTPDPLAEKYYHLSPYVYCADNPINAIDPDGRKVVLVGEHEQRMEILRNLQMLTNDKLGMKKDGSIFIMSKGTKNVKKNLSVGTSLIADIIGDKHLMRIEMDSEQGNHVSDIEKENASNGKGTDVNVNFDPSNRLVSTINPKNKWLYAAGRPSYIGLAHELVHGIRDMHGEAINYDIMVDHSVLNYKGKKKILKARKEELLVIGVMGNYKYTENKIRREHNLNMRGAH